MEGHAKLCIDTFEKKCVSIKCPYDDWGLKYHFTDNQN